MRTKMGQHSEETNELYNLMARHIKKRCEERINLYTVEKAAAAKQKENNILTENAIQLMDE